MIECACSCDGDSEGIFIRAHGLGDREYRTCVECGSTIWPWEPYTVGYWWDCEGCDRWDDADDCGCGDHCPRDLPATSQDYMCGPCAAACKTLLCDCWFVGMVWESIAANNGLTMAECIGTKP